MKFVSIAKTVFALWAVVLLCSETALAEEAAKEKKAPPCSGDEYRQLDFWVGTWDAAWADGGKGRNVITRTMGDCVIEERFEDLSEAKDGAKPLIGMSVSTYSKAAKAWRQTWVDNTGAYLPFTGGESEEGFYFRLQGAPNAKRTMRMIWKNVKPDSFDWHWQKSEDGAKTWEDVWVIRYTRAK